VSKWGRRGDFTTPANGLQRTSAYRRIRTVKLMLALEIRGNDRKLAQTNPTTLRERPVLAQAESASFRHSPAVVLFYCAGQVA
jgi:hypothetical protein